MEFDLTPENIVAREDGSFVVRIVGGEFDGMEYQTTPTYNPELYAQCCAALGKPMPVAAGNIIEGM